MGPTDRTSFADYAGNWAEDHVEDGIRLPHAMHQALEQAGAEEDCEVPDEEWFEDDLLSLIQSRPSRQARRANPAH